MNIYYNTDTVKRYIIKYIYNINFYLNDVINDCCMMFFTYNDIVCTVNSNLTDVYTSSDSLNI